MIEIGYMECKEDRKEKTSFRSLLQFKICLTSVGIQCILN